VSTYALRPRARHLRSIRRALLVGALVATGASIAADQATAAYSAQVSGGALTLNGNGASDQLALRLQAGAPATLQVDVGNDGSADFSVDRATFDRIVVNAAGGDDLVTIDDVNGTFTDTEQTTVNGGPGDDTLLGGGGAETFNGGPGRDAIDGNRGADVAFMGPGEDTFTWDPGDGSDVVEGQSGMDTLDFNGAPGDESFDLSANGPRLRFFRDLGNITMDMDGVERVDLDALGGADTVTQNDLSGTDARQFLVDLQGPGGGGDGGADSVVVNGTKGSDHIKVQPEGGTVVVRGLAARTQITGSEAANDHLTVNGQGGNDRVKLGDGLSSLINVVVNP
jgi:Ca2+-binding RTX toxin-like protein